MDMKLEQEDRFRLLVQAQDEDRRAIRSLLGREETPVAAPSIAHVPLMKMGPHDDPEAFVDLFEITAGGVWLGAQPVGRCAWSPCWRGKRRVAAQQFACREPPGLRRSQTGHPPTCRPKPRAAPSTLPLRGARGLWPTVCDGSAAPGRVPQVASWPSPATSRELSTWWCWSSSSPDYPARTADGSSATPDVAGSGHPAGGGPSGAWQGSASPEIEREREKKGKRKEERREKEKSQVAADGGRARHGVGMARPTVTPGEGGGQSPLPLHRTLSGNPLPTLLPLGRR